MFWKNRALSDTSRWRKREKGSVFEQIVEYFYVI